MLFFLTLGKGILTSITIFFVLFGIFVDNMHPGTGFELDYESFQFMIAAALTVVVNIEVGMYVCTFVFVCVCGVGVLQI